MMNYIWSAIIIFSIIYAFLSGNIQNLETAFTESSVSAVEFVLRFCGIMAMWSGLMEIAHRTGLIHRVSIILKPITSFIFPTQTDSEILSTIVMSFMANLFGAGNSSTVFALKTMELLDKQNKMSPIASDDMCTFAVVNMAFAPIFPIMTVQIRTSLGSASPYSTVIPSLVASLATIFVSIIVCKYYERKQL